MGRTGNMKERSGMRVMLRWGVTWLALGLGVVGLATPAAARTRPEDPEYQAFQEDRKSVV